MMKQWFAASILSLAVLPMTAQDRNTPVSLPVGAVEEVVDFQTKDYPGKVTSVARVDLVPQVNGEILELGFKNGDIVKTGQLLYRLDPVKYEAAVKNVEAKIAEYKARIAYAESNYNRNKKLSDVQAVSQDTLESVGSTLNAYRASLAAAEAELISAQDDLAHCRIIAPIQGKISSTNFTEGNYVTTASGSLATIIQSSPIRVRFSISNRDLLNLFGNTAKLCRNGIVKLTLANGKEFDETGSIEYVEDEAESETDSVQLFALFQNRSRGLIPGSTLTVSLSSREGVRKPAVPQSAIMQDIKGTYVWVVGTDSRVAKRYIERGGIVKELLLVESGFQADERIVTDGTHKISAGEPVRPVSGGE